MPPKKKTPSTRRATQRKPNRNPIYLDNNGTTLVAEPVRKVHDEWLKCYNVSTDSRASQPARKMYEKAVDDILAHCGTNTSSHTVIFTANGTEANCLIIRSCVKAYKKKLAERDIDVVPHIVASEIEHTSIIECLKDLSDYGEVDVTYVKPTIYGNILPEAVEQAICAHTCLIIVMFANNEIPAINNIKAIADIASRNDIPLHSDCVQAFGKYRIDVRKYGISSLAASAHKFYGPKGVGLLIVDNKLIEGYGLTGEINGAQQSGMRGGTIDIAGIASMLSAVKHAFAKRKEKNAKLLALRMRLLELLRSEFTFAEYTDYLYSIEERKKRSAARDIPDENDGHADLELVSLGPPDDKTSFILPNTVLLAVCKNRGRPFCNVDLKHALDKKNIIISIGSACATSSEKASHVLQAIGAPPVIKRGVIRVSFGDNNTYAEVDAFVTELARAIRAQCKDL